MPSPHAFLVGDQVFIDPHPGTQLRVVQQIARRVMTGAGPSKYFLRGNRGSGKSFLVRRGVLHALALAVPGLRYVVVRRNYPDLESNHLIYLPGEMEQLGGTWNEAKKIARYANGSLGFYRQCEDEKDVEKIVGAEAAILFVDEAPQIRWSLLRTMAPSLRVAKRADGSQPYYIAEVYGGNPIGESIEELDAYFVTQDVDPLEDPQYQPDDWCHVPIHRADNPSLDETEYLKQFAGVPAHFRKAWIDGERMDARTLFTVHPILTEKARTTLAGAPRPVPLPEDRVGQPYHYLQELPTVGGVPLLALPWAQVYRAYDHGFYPDPAVCLWLVVAGRRIVAVHEETWFSTPARDVGKAILQTTRELVGERPVAMTYADPEIDWQRGADVTVKDTLEIAGVPIECSINDRAAYADAIHSLLGEEIEPGVPRFQIYEPGCPMLAKYLPKMRWDEKNPRKMADHKYDHWITALAFFALSSGVLSETAPTRTTHPEALGLQWLREDAARTRRRSA